MYLVFDAIQHRINLLGSYPFPKETDENSILDLGPHTPKNRLYGSANIILISSHQWGMNFKQPAITKLYSCSPWRCPLIRGLIIEAAPQVTMKAKTDVMMTTLTTWDTPFVQKQEKTWLRSLHAVAFYDKIGQFIQRYCNSPVQQRRDEQKHCTSL